MTTYVLQKYDVVAPKIQVGDVSMCGISMPIGAKPCGFMQGPGGEGVQLMVLQSPNAPRVWHPMRALSTTGMVTLPGMRTLGPMIGSIPGPGGPICFFPDLPWPAEGEELANIEAEGQG